MPKSQPSKMKQVAVRRPRLHERIRKSYKKAKKTKDVPAMNKAMDRWEKAKNSKRRALKFK